MFTFWLVFHRPYIEGRSSTADTAPVMADITWVMAEPRPRGNPRLKRQVTQVTLPTDDFPNQHGCCLVLASSQYQQLKFSSQQNLIYVIYNMHIYILYASVTNNFRVHPSAGCGCVASLHPGAVGVAPGPWNTGPTGLQWGGGLRTGTRHKLGIIPSPYQGHYPVKSTWFDLGKCLVDVLKPLGCPKKRW